MPVCGIQTPRAPTSSRNIPRGTSILPVPAAVGACIAEVAAAAVGAAAQCSSTVLGAPHGLTLHCVKNHTLYSLVASSRLGSR